MEGLRDKKQFLKVGDWMCKMDKKEAYFSVPFSSRSHKLVSFYWKGILYEFLRLAFSLGPAEKKFTKLMKIPISLSKKDGSEAGHLFYRPNDHCPLEGGMNDGPGWLDREEFLWVKIFQKSTLFSIFWRFGSHIHDIANLEQTFAKFFEQISAMESLVEWINLKKTWPWRVLTRLILAYAVTFWIWQLFSNPESGTLNLESGILNPEQTSRTSTLSDHSFYCFIHLDTVVSKSNDIHCKL